MTALIIQNSQDRETKVKDGIDFLLSHCVGRQKLFPRKMSTFASEGKQFTIYNKEQILDDCIKSNFIDCRLNAYPVLEDGILQAPNIIFIDLDLPSKYSDYQNNLQLLEKNLDQSLKIIKGKLSGFTPTIVWTGNGYHIYIVLDIRPLELISDLKELSSNPSYEFLRYTENIFTNNKGDRNHKPSFNSCLLRIPETFNSKNSSGVKIIQRYNVNKIPSIDNQQLLREFRLFLADMDIRQKRIAEPNTKRGNISVKNLYHSTTQYIWIERLLETAIEDGRKYTLWKILCPYLVNVKKLQYEESYKILKTWLEKCNELKNLDFNPDVEIKAKLNHVKNYNPIAFKTLMEDNKNLYLLLHYKYIGLEYS